HGGAVNDTYIVLIDATAAAAPLDAFVHELEAKHGVHVTRIFRTAVRGFAMIATPAQAREVARDRRVRVVEENVQMRLAGTTTVATGEPRNTVVAVPGWGLARISSRLAAYPHQY